MLFRWHSKPGVLTKNRGITTSKLMNSPFRPYPCPLPNQQGGGICIWGCPPDHRERPMLFRWHSKPGVLTKNRGITTSKLMNSPFRPYSCPLPNQQGGGICIWGCPPDHPKRLRPFGLRCFGTLLGARWNNVRGLNFMGSEVVVLALRSSFRRGRKVVGYTS